MPKLLLSALLLLFALQPATAQEILQPDQLTSGEITETAPTVSYFIAMRNGQTFQLQAVVATTGLNLQAALNTATGTLVQAIPNLNNSPVLEAEFTANADGIFRLDISSANEITGMFVLIIQSVTPPEPEAEITVDELTADTLQSNATIVYALSGSSASRMILSIATTNPQDSLDVELLSSTGAVVASLETQETGSELLIPARSTDYQLHLNNAQETAVSYEITLVSLDGPISTPIAPPTTIATLPATLPATSPTTCTVTPRSIPVNIRHGPDLQFPTFNSLAVGTTLIGVARNPEGTWYQVDTGNGLGWVATSVIMSEGPCSSLQVIFIPTPTFSPATSLPTEMPTVPATSAAAPRCLPYNFYHTVDSGEYIAVALPAADVDTVISYLDGYRSQHVVASTCRAIFWVGMTFTCEQGSSGRAFWEIDQNAVFWSMDLLLVCDLHSNHNQSGLSFGRN